MSSVLVTGANGFIGSHIVQQLKDENKVISLVYSAVPGRGLDTALEGTTVINCDVRDHHALRRILARYEVNQVFHTAAISIVKTAYLDPIGVFDVNAMGTVALLEACRQVGVEKILVLNTDKVYGEGLDATEDKPYQPGEPYAASKCCQGFIVHSFINTYDMNIVMSHSCNVFGFDPNSNRIVPNVVKSCLKGKNPKIFTNDDSVREYVYVEDVVSAFKRLMNEDEHRGSRNISTGWVYNQKDIVLKILEHFESLEPEYVEGKVPSQIGMQSLKSTRWDWKPEWSFDSAIKATIDKFALYSGDWK
jgi:CDP-glucose 4,6-dehydratase